MLWLLSFYLLGQSSCQTPYELWPVNDVVFYVACLNDAPDCPSADAGHNQWALRNSSISLDGSGSLSGGGSVAYAWAQVDNGAPLLNLQQANTATPNFTASQAGLYLLELTVQVSCRSDVDRVAVEVTGEGAPAAVNVTEVFSDFNRDWVLVTHAGDNRLFLVDRDGTIWIHENGALLPTPFLDLSAIVTTSTEEGLLGLAFHPNYAVNGFFYVSLTADNPACMTDANSESQILGFHVSADPNVADPASATTLFSTCQPRDNHNGGHLAFGPEGYLHFGLGDGGTENFDNDHPSQDPTQVLGKVLRYQVNGLGPLTIPATNPYLADGGTLDEILHMGLRNPWRFSFDFFTGDMYLGDVGAASREEIDFVPAGAGGFNFGWICREGSLTHPGTPPTVCNNPSAFTDPIWEYDHSMGCTVIGGHVYRGSEVPEMRGFYLYTDWCGGLHKLLRRENGVWVHYNLDVYLNDNLLQAFGNQSYGEDVQGALYYCTKGGAVYKFESLRE